MRDGAATQAGAGSGAGAAAVPLAVASREYREGADLVATATQNPGAVTPFASRKKESWRPLAADETSLLGRLLLPPLLLLLIKGVLDGAPAACERRRYLLCPPLSSSRVLI
mmetsp:Transcript_17791/g.45588  ORF Transcript_17791/g.45588 Transcript_17791/m.45588 type:complete len:111 (-) Transcript_17791:782-1114(-)